MSLQVPVGPVFKPGLFSSGGPRQRGFTVVELVVVLIVIGVVAAVVLPRLQRGNGFEERGFRDEVAAALRYAQKSAIAARRTVCVTFTTVPSTLSVRISDAFGATDCTAGNPLLGPDDRNLVVAAQAPAAFAAVPAVVNFDAAGRPNAVAVINFVGLPGALALTIEAETGYVR